MRKNQAILVSVSSKIVGSPGYDDGYLLPGNPQNSGLYEANSGADDGLMVPNRQKPGRRAFLDGNYARRTHPVRAG